MGAVEAGDGDIRGERFGEETAKREGVARKLASEGAAEDEDGRVVFFN